MAKPLYVTNEDPQYFCIHYFGDPDPARKQYLEDQWKRFSRPDPATGLTYPVWFRPTNRNLEVMVDRLMPPEAPAGKYRVEVFIPGKHATTRRAIFTVSHNFRTEGSQTLYDDPMVLVDMYDQYDVWYSLGEYQLDPAAHPLSGRVRQFDISLEDPPAEVTFGPVRWLPLVARAPGAVRFDSPVGSEEERNGPFPSGPVAFGKYPIWAGAWFDANPFLTWYNYGYHTGADLNLPGASGADKGKPIYATADGVVTYAGKAGSWGNIVVLYHPDALVTLPDGKSQRQPVYSRYGHVDDRILVRAGQEVQRGQNIALVGLPAGMISGWHLHFDISYTDLLRSRPGHWPNLSAIRSLQGRRASPMSAVYKQAQANVMKEVVSHFLDPLKFIQDNH